MRFIQQNFLEYLLYVSTILNALPGIWNIIHDSFLLLEVNISDNPETLIFWCVWG